MVGLASVLSWADCWLPHDLAYQLLAEMRIDFYNTLDPLAPAYLARRRSGDLVSIAGADVETVELFFAHTITPAFIAVVVPAGILMVLGAVGWPLMLALAPFLVLLASSPFLARKRSDRLGGAVRRDLGHLNAHLVDSIQGMREVVSFGHEKHQVAAVLANSLRLAKAQLAFHKDQALQASFNEAVTGLGALAVLSTGVWLVGQLEMDRALLPLGQRAGAAGLRAGDRRRPHGQGADGDAGVGPPRVRGEGRARAGAGRRRRPGPRGERPHPAGHPLRPRELRLRRRQRPRAPGRVPRRGAGTDRGPGGSLGGRQDHLCAPPAALSGTRPPARCGWRTGTSGTSP